MCYTLYLSTDSDSDLSTHNSDLITFMPLAQARNNGCADLLAYPRKWFVGSKSVCSCTFRHLAEPELGFGEPVEWYEEEPDAVAATRELYVVIEGLIAAGHRVDCVDSWEGVCPTQIESMDVPWREVTQEAFRLFENYRLNFCSS